jgi:hypothetical protein
MYVTSMMVMSTVDVALDIYVTSMMSRWYRCCPRYLCQKIICIPCVILFFMGRGSEYTKPKCL